MTDQTPEARLAAALAKAWPGHIEGSGSSGTQYTVPPPETKYWVKDPCLPSEGLAAATIAALADDGYTIVSQMEWMDRADPTLAADLALAEKARYLLNGAHDQLRLLRSVVLCGEQLSANESETLSGLLAAIEEALRDE